MQKIPYLGEHENVVLFDGVCKLCNAWSNFLMRHDHRRRFRLASVQSPEGKAILAHFNYPTDYYDTMLVVHGGRAFDKSDAFFAVMGELGLPWKAALVFKPIPRRLRNWLYDRIALNRYKLFGKYEYCALPAPGQEERFLGGAK
ncbi:thiol-disulfide oxidoreductase DCC family protein [Massilia suwonensis]|uniref:Thiol-disulfide oxidoreductase DCC family protein n=1 Tax=Massilia suwonensis TaxID=648895 RepID=A0ABW0MIF5_9BURK